MMNRLTPVLALFFKRHRCLKNSELMFLSVGASGQLATRPSGVCLSSFAYIMESSNKINLGDTKKIRGEEAICASCGERE